MGRSKVHRGMRESVVRGERDWKRGRGTRRSLRSRAIEEISDTKCCGFCRGEWKVLGGKGIGRV